MYVHPGPTWFLYLANTAVIETRAVMATRSDMSSHTQNFTMSCHLFAVLGTISAAILSGPAASDKVANVQNAVSLCNNNLTSTNALKRIPDFLPGLGRRVRRNGVTYAAILHASPAILYINIY